jgi:hypothetical protein
MTPESLGYVVVIAKYKEDISWSNSIDSKCLKIYNKGPDGDIPNVGREGETFLRYIIEHYDSLPECVIFLQGDPFVHMAFGVNEKNIGEKIVNTFFDDSNWKIQPCFNIWFLVKHYTFKGLNMKKYYEYFFPGKDLENDNIKYAAGCQYFIRKSAILQNPKDFYVKLQSMLVKGSQKYEKNHSQAHDGDNPFDETEINGWTLERLWGYFFE